MYILIDVQIDQPGTYWYHSVCTILTQIAKGPFC